MTIGERLKEIRDSLNLTQAEMCAGVVTESFYSRVENGKSEINIDDLLAILKQNHVSVRDFFSVFDQSMHQYHCIRSAISNHNIALLKKVQIDQPIFEVEATAIIATLLNKKVHLSDAARRKIKSNFDRLGEWDETALWNMAGFMSLYDTNELKILVVDIVKNKNSINLNDSSTLVALANVMVSYLGRLYLEEDFGAVLEIIHFIKELPTNPVIMFSKLVAIYYSTLINHDQKRLKLITEVLQKNGYSNYLAWLPKR